MPRTRTSLAALALAAAASVGAVAPALAHCPEPATFFLSDENNERYLDAPAEERRLIEQNPEYREVWTDCLPPSRVEPNVWGPGYVCIPEGALQ
ncbi:hypothetical protein OG897_33595 [Streptomyces sp. NBC_00237]|uniref:hypothetical protein n=1 Tax=Streptomyces sp. NBC_00237 TaxID=2975687 RepID=UPI00224DBE80|nr:hypothetical protein [Streptomyces sp. NBC_00237]MCX5206328.1 hypothetical protein [Streptomyces sp. NBC_00237]